MTVVVSKGLISRSLQSQAEATQNQSKLSQEVQTQVIRGGDASKAAALASATVSISSDAAVNNVKFARAERAEGRVRIFKEASELADNLGQRIKDGEDGGGERAHSGLDPIGASGHLK